MLWEGASGSSFGHPFSLVRGAIPGLSQLLANMVLQDRQHGGAGEAYHRAPLTASQRPEHLPLRAHDDVASPGWRS